MMNRWQISGLIYLYLLPAVVAAIGFGVGQVDVHLYLPLWAVNVCLLLLAIWQFIKTGTNAGERKFGSWTSAALLLIIPWILFSVFAGMGPPPVTIATWVATALTQQLRYTILICGGLSAFLGFALLKTKLENRGERLYSTLGFTVLSVAVPLFILNMAFWGYYLTNAFRYFITLPQGNRPELYAPVKMFFDVIAVIEVTLIYLATIFFATALKKIDILTVRASRWYIIISSLGILLVLLPPSFPEPFRAGSYLAAIPAIPFIMPYLIGVRLLRCNKTCTITVVPPLILRT